MKQSFFTFIFQIMLKKLFTASLLMAVGLTGSAITYKYDKLDKSARTCRLLSWGGTQPTSGKLVLKDTYEEGGITYRITSMAPGALDNLTEVTEITIGANMKSMAANKLDNTQKDCENFRNCPNLRVFKVAEGNEIYAATGDGILVDKAGLMCIRVPQKVATTSGRLKIPSRIGSFAYNAFAENSTVTYLSLPADLMYVNHNCGFNSMLNLASFEVSVENSESISVVAGVLYNKEMTEIISFPPRKGAAEFNLPATVRIIKAEAFRNTNNLYRVGIDQVERIDREAFRASGLAEVELPNRNLQLGEGIFRDCYRLVKINIPHKTEIPADFARDCKSLTSVYSFSGDCSYGDNAFKNCPRLATFRFTPDTALSGDSIFAGCGFTEVEFASGAIPYDGLPMGHQTFYGCRNLRSVDMSGLVVAGGNIGAEVGVEFVADCPALETVKFPRLVNFWGRNGNEASNFGVNSPVSTIVLGAFEATSCPILSYSEGIRSPKVYMLTTGAPYRSWPLRMFCAAYGNAVVRPVFMCESFSMSFSDIGDASEYVCPGGVYYVPGQARENYKEAAKQGCMVNEMFSLTVFKEQGEIMLKSNLGSQIKFGNVSVDNGFAGIPDESGRLLVGEALRSGSVLKLEYSVDGIAMQTEYPISSLAGVGGVAADGSALFGIVQEGRRVGFTEVADYCVTSMSGAVIASGRGSDVLLPAGTLSGVYIVSAVNAAGDRALEKIILR